MLDQVSRISKVLFIVSVVMPFVIGSEAFSVTNPSLVQDQSKILDYVKVDVNGQSHLVKRGDKLTVVKGDKVKFDKVALVDPNAKVANVNLVGYQNSQALRPAEDRGFTIDTARDLVKRWSVEKEAEIYLVKAFTGSSQHGEVFLQVLEPTLEYAVLKINGNTTILREKEFVHVKASDQIKVEQVKTNVENDNQNVRFQIVPVEVEGKFNGMKFYEIRFLRNNTVFAKIPMQVEGT